MQYKVTRTITIIVEAKDEAEAEAIAKKMGGAVIAISEKK